jgi:4'-phosphopantetheinyl transferase
MSALVELFSTDLRWPDARAARALSTDEWRRAARLRRLQDRRAFVAGRAFLRAVLAARLGTRPDRIVFRYGRYGKPELDPSVHHERVHFSLSHAGGRAWLGVTHAGPVGVDVEVATFAPRPSEVAETCLAQHAARALLALPEPKRTHRFLRLWTATEAVLKAAGTGLSGRLPDLPADSDGPFEICLDDGDSEPWWAHDLDMRGPAVGAVALRADAVEIYPQRARSTASGAASLHHRTHEQRRDDVGARRQAAEG